MRFWSIFPALITNIYIIETCLFKWMYVLYRMSNESRVQRWPEPVRVVWQIWCQDVTGPGIHHSHVWPIVTMSWAPRSWVMRQAWCPHRPMRMPHNYSRPMTSQDFSPYDKWWLAPGRASPRREMWWCNVWALPVVTWIYVFIIAEKSISGNLVCGNDK